MAEKPREKIENELLSILPDRPESINDLSVPDSSGLIEHEVQKALNKQISAKERAQRRYAVLREKTVERRIAAGGTATRTPYQNQSILRQEAEDARNEALRLLDDAQKHENVPACTTEQVVSGPIIAAPKNYGAGITRPEVVRLLSALNINLDVQLTKQDTTNLLACLLTCNEAQLDALYNNAKIPIVIKALIKRLKEDVKLGNIGTVEKLWDRIFGKTMLTDEAKTDDAQALLPKGPLSREAYIIIRNQLIDD